MDDAGEPRLFAVLVGPSDRARWRVLVRAESPQRAAELVGSRGQTVHGVEPASKPAKAVHRPTTCGVCGYSLRGVPDRDGHVQCPECGLIAVPVDESAVWSVVREAHRDGRRRVVTALLTLTVVVIVLGLLVVLLG
jgi:hypothetical protein